MLMEFTIFAEDANYDVYVYTVSMTASYSEIEEASKKKNFISWVIANATQIECTSCIGDFTSNDFLETILWDADKKIVTFFLASGDDIKLLPKYTEPNF